MIINADTQVRLSIELQGRLGAKAPNSSTKKQIRNVIKAAMNGKIIKVPYHAAAVQEAKQTLLIGYGAPLFYTTDEGKPARIAPGAWRHKDAIKRLEEHLQIIADSISGHTDTKFNYEIIN